VLNSSTSASLRQCWVLAGVRPKRAKRCVDALFVLFHVVSIQRDTDYNETVDGDESEEVSLRFERHIHAIRCSQTKTPKKGAKPAKPKKESKAKEKKERKTKEKKLSQEEKAKLEEADAAESHSHSGEVASLFSVAVLQRLVLRSGARRTRRY
jgi:hypothetical protein